jgi:hypothetical protein
MKGSELENKRRAPPAHWEEAVEANPTTEGASKIKFPIWLPILACPLGVVLGRYVGPYALAFVGYQAAPAPPGVPSSLYDGTMPGGIYGGIGAFVAAFVVGVVWRRWKPWLMLVASVAAGALFAALGAILET